MTTTTEVKLEHARRELAEYEARNPRSKEDVADDVKEWIDGAVRVGRQDVAGLLGSANRLGLEAQFALTRAYVLDQPEFANWLLTEAGDEGLPSRRDREKHVEKLRRAVRDAEAALAREEIETKKAALEDELKALA